MGCQCSKNSTDSTPAPAAKSCETSKDSPKCVPESPGPEAPVTTDEKPSQQIMSGASVEDANAAVVAQETPAEKSESTPAEQPRAPAPPRGKSATAMWEDAVEEPQGANESYEAYHSADSEEQRNSQTANKQSANPKKSNNRPRKKKGGRN
jgi:hypothetical protein